MKVVMGRFNCALAYTIYIYISLLRANHNTKFIQERKWKWKFHIGL